MWRSVLRVSAVCLRRPSPQCGAVRLPSIPQPCVRRAFSSRGPASPQVTFIGFYNPLTWLRTRAYFYFLRTFLDPELSVQEFNRGARQAFLLVSEKLSQDKFDELENLVDKKVLKVLQKEFAHLSDNYKKAVAADSNEIVHLSPVDISLYMGENEKKFVNVLMRFWYLKDVDVVEDELQNQPIFKLTFGNQEGKDKRCIITATYEFRRKYTPEGQTDWIITHIEHSQFH